MRWYQALTLTQRRILLAMAAALILVLGLLGWSVWQTMRYGSTLSPLPTPTAAPPSLTPTLTTTPRPTLSPTPTATPLPTPTFDVADAGSIADRVAEARGVLLRWGTPLTLVDAHELTVYLYRRYNQAPPLALQMEPLLRALRLWFWDDIAPDPRAQAQHTAALYIPETEELYFRRDWSGTHEVLDAQLAFSYARAIPGQYGEIPRLLAEATTLDRRLALTAVAEGDALVSLWLYAGVEPDSAQAWAFTDGVAQALVPVWQPEDALLNDVSRLTLDLGGAFAAARYAQGGTAALDAAMLRPPRSTEQLLHPERYELDEPPVALSPITVDLGEEWSLLHQDTLGEAMLGLVFLEWSHGYWGQEAAEGWGGDLLQVWAGPDGQDVVLLHLAWDSARTAGLFYGRLLEILPQALVRGLVPDITPPAALPRGRWWSGGQGAVFLRRDVEQVYLLWGSDVDAVATVGRALETSGGVQPRNVH